jgi:hypothetical protein
METGIHVHATNLATGSSWNEDLDAKRLHMERDEFLSHHDTPSLYTGSAGKLVLVNDDENALVFGDGVSTFLELDDTPSSYSGQGTKYVRVNTGSTGLEFYDAPGGNGDGELVGVLVHDEGVFLGTGTIINVVGDHLAMSLSGSVAQIEQGDLFLPTHDDFWVRGTGTLSYTANNTWERIGYVTGTISVDRDCSLILTISGQIWGTSGNPERLYVQFELDGTRQGRQWAQTQDTNPAQSERWWLHFMEIFDVSSGTHGIAAYTWDGGSSVDRSFTSLALYVETMDGATWQV